MVRFSNAMAVVAMAACIAPATARAQTTTGAPAADVAPWQEIRCTYPVEAVQVCESTRGYRFSIPSPGTCAEGSRSVGIARLTCGAETRDPPSYHACVGGATGWTAVRSWETCASRSLRDAPGDFVPPGRTAAQGVGPDPAPVATIVGQRTAESSPTRGSYRDAAWATFGVSVATTFVGVGALGLLLGGPIVHWANGRGARGFAALGMNFGLSAAGFGLGALVGAGLWGGRGHGDFAGLGILLVAAGGAGVGLLTSNILNAALLCDYESPPPSEAPTPRRASFTVMPQVDLSPGRAHLGVLVAF